MTDEGFRSVVDDDGRTAMVDSGDVRYFTEEEPGTWALSVSTGNWEAWVALARHILATPQPEVIPDSSGEPLSGRSLRHVEALLDDEPRAT